MAVKITRLELSAADLRRTAARSGDAAAARRMLALAMVLEGCSRTQAAERAGMDRQTLRDWVHRYNAEGLGGLSDRLHPGPQPRLSAEQMKELEAIVLAGPDPERDGVVRWRRVDLQAVIRTRFDVALHERSVGKVLHRLVLRRQSVRPRHPRSEPEAQEAFKKTSARW
jgi:transposase